MRPRVKFEECPHCGRRGVYPEKARYGPWKGQVLYLRCRECGCEIPISALEPPAPPPRHRNYKEDTEPHLVGEDTPPITINENWYKLP